MSHKHDGRLPLPATLQRSATTFAAEAQWVWTVCLRLLPVRVATAIWNPGPHAKPFGSNAIVYVYLQFISLNTKNGVRNVINAKRRAYRRCLVVSLPLCRMTRLSVWDTFTTRLFRGKVHENVDITSSFTTFRIRQTAKKAFSSTSISFILRRCYARACFCLSVWLPPAQDDTWTRKRQGLF